MMVPAKGWPACRIVQAGAVVRQRDVTREERRSRIVAPAWWMPRGLNRAWSALSAMWRPPHGDKECMRALADMSDDELRNLSEAGQRMRREARLEQAASERKRGRSAATRSLPSRPPMI
jgi:cytochrome c553